jgi:SAM-dependent methyltransferase
VLPRIRPGGELVCCEPAAAMAALGRRRHPGPDVRWTDTLPAEIGRFDRVVCGAAIWLIDPVERALARWAGLLAHGGALAFNVPSAYIGLLDAAGAGDDPFLTGILLALGRHRTRPVPGPRVEPPSAERIDAALAAAGLVVERWSHRERLTQATLLDWLKIPAVSERLIEATDAAAREALLDRVYAEVDSDSWRWESWSGWTAWKR